MDKLEKILAHHGVLGMRWGFRKAGTGAPSSHKRGVGVSKDKVKANKAQSKIGRRGNTDRLNNDELQHLVNRLNLEKQYSSVSSQTTKSNPVAGFLKNIAVNVARKQIQAAANDVVAKQVKAALKSKGMT